MSRIAQRLLTIAFCLAAAPAAAIDVPYLTGRVVDNASILAAETRGRLAEAARAHEQATTNQIVVLTVPTIQPENIEDYAAEVFRGWQLGQRGKDNGVLLMVVPQDRKMRIEVGYGLEATLTDADCGRIIQALMTPAFKAGDYDKGIEDGLTAIITK
ncbi:MAG: TPM domain-containing protein, partial [Vicinamibacterales bacterium]|nr:TPM domain-containing protein [Vicinamibacterales bacterium]